MKTFDAAVTEEWSEVLQGSGSVMFDVIGAAPGLDHQKMISLNSLPVGTSFRRIQNGRPRFANIIQNIADHMKTGAGIDDVICDGTNTCVTLKVDFSAHPAIIRGRTLDRFEITVNDDLSSLQTFRAFGIGYLTDDTMSEPD